MTILNKYGKLCDQPEMPGLSSELVGMSWWLNESKEANDKTKQVALKCFANINAKFCDDPSFKSMVGQWTHTSIEDTLFHHLHQEYTTLSDGHIP